MLFALDIPEDQFARKYRGNAVQPFDRGLLMCVFSRDKAREQFIPTGKTIADDLKLSLVHSFGADAVRALVVLG
jgi:hypothetical protein